MAARASKNNILAGLFLLICLGLFVATVIILSSLGDALSAKNSFVVAFSLYDGAEGLEKGAPVKLGGKRIGRVTGSNFIFKEGTREPVGIDVAISVRADIDLYEDAVVQLAKPLLGSNSAVNIVAVTGLARQDPDYKGGAAALPKGGRLIGRLGAPGFLSQADYQKIQDIVGRVDKITADIEPQVKPIMDDARAAVGNVRTITDDAAKRWPLWGDKVDKTFADFEPIVANVKDFVAKAQASIDRNAKPFDEIIENIRQLSAKAKGEGYDEVLAAVRRGREGLESFAHAARQVDDLLTTKSPEIADMITSGNLAAQQLKLATVEIRAAPWRLLYQPNKKELENELLYNSVRAYSVAIAELHGASESLEAVSARIQAAGGDGAYSKIDQKTLDELNARLRNAFEKYKQEEKAFLDRWVKQ
jgi:ABC-type transporter Mla subunit MlaD